MKILDYLREPNEIRELIMRPLPDVSEAYSTVASILDDVRDRGDEAVFDYTEKFDGTGLSKGNVKVSSKEIKEAVKKTPPKLLKALKRAAENIGKVSGRQLSQIKEEWSIKVKDGVSVGEKTVPRSSVGCYIPGGRASYPSTVLMTAIPAITAGVEKIVVVSPPQVSDVVLAACDACGATAVFRVGGAQAVAALAYGTYSIPRVDKIVGPGNKYVTAAKSLAFSQGLCGIDSPAGPSELMVVADDTASPEYVAADILAQAEHDPDARCVLVSPSIDLIESVGGEVEKQAKGLPRPEIIAESIRSFTAVKTQDLAECVEFANQYAPEHVEVITEDARKLANEIESAAAVFIGPYSPVAAGDYASGGNHVLPTGGAARFSSPLSVRDFMKSVSVQELTEKGLTSLSDTVSDIADAEGLTAHRESIRKREQ